MVENRDLDALQERGRRGAVFSVFVGWAFFTRSSSFFTSTWVARSCCSQSGFSVFSVVDLLGGQRRR